MQDIEEEMKTSVCVCERQHMCVFSCVCHYCVTLSPSTIYVNLFNEANKKTTVFLLVDIGIGSLLIGKLIFFFPAIFWGEMCYKRCVCCCCSILSAFL